MHEAAQDLLEPAADVGGQVEQRAVRRALRALADAARGARPQPSPDPPLRATAGTELLAGDAPSCRVAASALRRAALTFAAETTRDAAQAGVAATPDPPRDADAAHADPIAALAAASREVAAALERFADDLGRAQREHAGATEDRQRHAALALAARARRRLRAACETAREAAAYAR